MSNYENLEERVINDELSTLNTFPEVGSKYKENISIYVLLSTSIPRMKIPDPSGCFSGFISLHLN